MWDAFFLLLFSLSKNPSLVKLSFWIIQISANERRYCGKGSKLLHFFFCKTNVHDCENALHLPIVFSIVGMDSCQAFAISSCSQARRFLVAVNLFRQAPKDLGFDAPSILRVVVYALNGLFGQSGVRKKVRWGVRQVAACLGNRTTGYPSPSPADRPIEVTPDNNVHWCLVLLGRNKKGKLCAVPTSSTCLLLGSRSIGTRECG
ncbi:hypothetical protein BX666DRAFT_1034519 [Dichotomocladium elegans]|nr:hypothetical protein BX666DRAFT_1034519 [Dichotomocladium elegans]